MNSSKEEEGTGESSQEEEEEVSAEIAPEQNPQEEPARPDLEEDENLSGKQVAPKKEAKDPEEKDFEALYSDTELKRKTQQSRADTMQFRNTVLSNENADLKTQLEQKQSNTENENIDFTNLEDDDYLQGKDIKNVIKQIAKTQREQKVVTPVQGNTANDEAFKSWVSVQPDLNQVNEYYTKNKAELDTYLSALGTDPIGEYMALRSLLPAEVNVPDKKPKKKKKSLVPITGPGGGSIREASGKQNNGFDKFFDQPWNR